MMLGRSLPYAGASDRFIDEPILNRQRLTAYVLGLGRSLTFRLGLPGTLGQTFFYLPYPVSDY